MALTKARLPVIEVSTMDFGTTQVAIASSGGPIDIDVAGLDNLDFTSTTAIFDDAVTVTANDLQTEVVSLDTTAGASATLETQATLATLGTDTAHPLELYANSITGLTIATDGKVELDVVGTASNHLVDKNYVDAGDTGALDGIVSNNVINGSVQIPNDTGNDLIINWGVTSTVSNDQLAVTFDTAFPNSAFVGYCVRQNGTASLESAAHINSLTTSGMNVVNSGGTTSPLGWLAIGF